jgi:hypothetical protein
MSKYVLMKTIVGIDNGQLLQMAVDNSNPFTVLPGEFTLEVQDPTGLDPTPPVTLPYRYITLTNLVPGPGSGGAEIRDMTEAEQVVADFATLQDFKADCEAEADKIHDFVTRLVSLNPSAINAKTASHKATINAQGSVPDIVANSHGLNIAAIRNKNRHYRHYFGTDKVENPDIVELFFEILEYYTT